MLPNLRHVIAVVLPVAMVALAHTDAGAQSTGQIQIGISARGISPGSPAPLLFQESQERPRWLKWGLIGAAAGAVTFAALGQSSPDPNPMLQDAVAGAAIGFVILGGSIAFYDWVCKPDSSSERMGLC